MATLVIGATSQIGHFVLSHLAGTDDHVIALGRDARRTVMTPAGIDWRVGRLPGGMPSLPSLPSIDRIISSGPLDGLADWLVTWASADNVQLLAISSMSAESKRNSTVHDDRRVSQRLRDGEQRLVEQCRRLGINWTVLRPTMIYGAGLDRNLTPIARRAARWRIFPMPNATGLRQPVHAEDVAIASIRAVGRSEASGRIIELGGGERLSVAEMFERVRASLPCRTVPLRLPGSLLRTGARLQPILRGPLDRLETDLVADNSEVERLLDVHPRPFRPDPETWGFAPR